MLDNDLLLAHAFACFRGHFYSLVVGSFLLFALGLCTMQLMLCGCECAIVCVSV